VEFRGKEIIVNVSNRGASFRNGFFSVGRGGNAEVKRGRTITGEVTAELGSFHERKGTVVGQAKRPGANERRNSAERGSNSKGINIKMRWNRWQRSGVSPWVA